MHRQVTETPDDSFHNETDNKKVINKIKFSFSVQLKVKIQNKGPGGNGLFYSVNHVKENKNVRGAGNLQVPYRIKILVQWTVVILSSLSIPVTSP